MDYFAASYCIDDAQGNSGSLSLKLDGVDITDVNLLPTLATRPNYTKPYVLEADFLNCKAYDGMLYSGKSTVIYEIVKSTSTEFTTKVTATANQLQTSQFYSGDIIVNGTIIITESRVLDAQGNITLQKTTTAQPNLTVYSFRNQFTAQVTAINRVETFNWVLKNGIPLTSITISERDTSDFISPGTALNGIDKSETIFKIGNDVFKAVNTIGDNKSTTAEVSSDSKMKLYKNNQLIVVGGSDDVAPHGVSIASYPVF